MKYQKQTYHYINGTPFGTPFGTPYGKIHDRPHGTPYGTPRGRHCQKKIDKQQDCKIVNRNKTNDTE